MAALNVRWICRPSRYFPLAVAALVSACGDAKTSGFGGDSKGGEAAGTQDRGQAGTNVNAGGHFEGAAGSVDIGDDPVDTDTDSGGVAVWPPPGFVNVTDGVVGAYALGPEVTEDPEAASDFMGTAQAPGKCGGLFAVVRDFKLGNVEGGHPDFETHMASDVGIVSDTLGEDHKPVYAKPNGKTATTSGAANFDQWFRDVPDVNRTFVLGLHMVANNGVLTFQADEFFPLDDQGFGNESQAHNFAFTTEIHTTFLYNGGETFTFIGDDDVFGFINNRLVIDLGGVHNAKTKRVDLDALSSELRIEKGKVYDLAVFHAERHTVESHFRIDSTLTFMDCGQVVR